MSAAAARSVGRYGALLEAVRGMTWPAPRPAPAGGPGSHRSRLRGVSPEFSEYRRYRQGDDPRRLDWKLLARTDRAFLRLATDRSVLPVAMLLDASVSMEFPRGEDTKWAQARRVAIGLAAVALGAADPVGVTVAADGTAMRRTQPRTRGGTLGEIARTLDETTPSGRLSDALLTELEQLRWAARVVVVSDFLDELASPRVRRPVAAPSGGWDEGMVGALVGVAAAGVEAHAVHLVAPDELAPPSSGFVAVDPEAPAVRRPVIPEALAEYQERFAAWRARLADALRAGGVAYHLVRSDEPPARAIRRITASTR